jgi:23S rRNA (cytosine1962-C5)-methyltransferase
VEKGYLWVYRDRIAGMVDAGPGQLVQVEGPSGQVLGTAHYSDRSRIALRMLTRGPQPPDEPRLIRDRLIEARQLRERLLPVRAARRLVYSEADGLPGLILDQYADALVLQTLTQGAETRQALILELCCELFSPRQVLLRNDVKVRELEALPLERRVLLGQPPFEVEVQDGALRMSVDLWDGQKTGAFLDQQENHRFVAQIARGRVLDLFTYTGGFALHAAARAESTVGVDTSRSAISRANDAARRSGLTNTEWVCDNVFRFLQSARQRGERFETIVIDPPAFAKRRSDLPAALKGYRDLNRRALALLAPFGALVTCSCSYNLAEDEFVSVVRQAAESAGRRLVLLERRGQSPDHPEILGLPESRYLKCLVLAARP